MSIEVKSGSNAPPNQTIHGTVQKIIQEGNKKTYVIVIKPNAEGLKLPKKTTVRPQLTKKNETVSDVVKQNLNNITDEDYDSKKSAANLFLKEDEENTLWTCENGSCDTNGGNGNNAQKEKKSLKDNSAADEGISHDSLFNATPTNLQFDAKHSAVRQIVLTSPDLQRTSSVVRKLDGETKQSPLASSTPFSSAGQINSPDSGIYSASSSLLSPSLTSNQTQLITKLIQQPALNSQVKEESNSVQEDGSEDKLNTSLANIQWLGGFVLEQEEKEREPRQHIVNRMSVEDKCRRKPFELEEIDRLIRECGEFQRPPYSYMVLIQLALSSAPDHKMTLREICKWIEEKFSYFRSVAKPGWKNSIRHNLSFYHCFARDLSNKKKHGSKWMLQFDPVDPVKENFQERIITSQVTTSIQNSQTPTVYPLLSMFSSLPNNNLIIPSVQQYPAQPQNNCGNNFGLSTMGSGGLQNKKRKSTGPLPILPRPATLQTYALVPLQSVQQQSSSNLPTIPNPARPIIVNVPSNTFPQNISHRPQSVLSQQNQPAVSCATTHIRQKPSTSTESMNLVHQAWLDAQCSAEDSDNARPEKLGVEPFSETFLNASNQRQNETVQQQSKKQKVKAGLPVPTIYSSNPRKAKRTKSRLKSSNPNLLLEERNLLDSSDSECEGDEVKDSDLPTPIRQLFSDTPSKENVISTSTPVRNSGISPMHLPSPIRGLTPVRCGNVFEGSFLDMIQEEVFATLSCPQNVGANVNINQGSPNVSLSDFGLFRTPPDKRSGQTPQNSNNISHGQSLCRFLADFPIDANLIADVDGLPSDISLNWSYQQPTDQPK